MKRIRPIWKIIFLVPPFANLRLPVSPYAKEGLGGISSRSQLKFLSVLVLGISLLSLGGCSGSEEDYQAVYQVVPDAHILYLGNHYFIAKDNDGGYFLVHADGFGEANYVKRLN